MHQGFSSVLLEAIASAGLWNNHPQSCCLATFRNLSHSLGSDLGTCIKGSRHLGMRLCVVFPPQADVLSLVSRIARAMLCNEENTHKHTHTHTQAVAFFAHQRLTSFHWSTGQRGRSQNRKTHKRHNTPHTAHLSAKLATHASDASSQDAPHAPSGSSLPSQQSQTPSPTLEEGSRMERCPRLAHSKTPGHVASIDIDTKTEVVFTDLS